MKLLVSLLFIPFYCSTLAFALECRHPPPAPNFSNELYEGVWYDIGVYQTPGGAFFQRNQICTSALYEPLPGENNGGNITYSSRTETPDGQLNVLQAILTPSGEPGQFIETFPDLNNNQADYNVIWIDDDSAIEYDCVQRSLPFPTDYCVHFMSRTPSITPEKLAELMDFVDSFDLNANNLDFRETIHDPLCYA